MDKEEIEAIELKKQQGCKIAKCGVVDNNIRLRIENIKLQKQVEQLKNKVEEQERLKKILKKDINACKAEIVTVQNGRNRNELKGSERRRLASVSGRQNEAIRILNLLEGEK